MPDNKDKVEPYYQDLHNTLYNCNFLDNDLPDESIQMVVTSPPYWGLRKYSGEQDLIWGDNHCEYEWGEERIIKRGHPGNESTLVGTQTADLPKAANNQGSFCSLCGGWKGAYGLEPTPEMYIQHTIEILREIKRVLRKDGVVFWNIGDSYSGSGKGIGQDNHGKAVFHDNDIAKTDWKTTGLKPKDLCLIPFRVAIAAQEDGWWVRSVIIWSKPNPMPESVTDRPTESHEYILMLTKSARYYWDAEAVRTGYQQSSIDRADGSKVTTSNPDRPVGFTRDLGNGANLKSVWTFPTQPFPAAHFAVFPEKLPELCIKAATPEVGCCSKCGSPWVRIVEKTGHINKREPAYVPDNTPTKTDSTGWGPVAMGTNNWQPTCKCNADKMPSVCLDPFTGAGTTLWVAKALNRKAIGYELSEEYCRLTVERNRQQVMVCLDAQS